MNTKLLKQKILDLAIRGKLTQQLKSDGTAADLLKEICDRTQEKTSLRAKRGNPSPQTIIPLDKSEAPFEIPENWEWVRLGNVAYIASGSTPSKDCFVESGVPYLKMYNLRNQQIDFEYKPQYIKREVHEGKLARSKAKPGDVIMNIVGPPLGKVALVPESLPECNFNQAAVLIRAHFCTNLMNQYIRYFLLQMDEINAINTKGTAGQENISLTQTQNMRFPLPPLAEQQRIVEKIQEAFAEIEAIEKNKELLKTHIKQTRQKILDLAIHGKLVPQNKSDEPASVLLERITRDNPHYEKLTDVPFEIPDSWEWVKLGDVVKQVTDFVASGSFASLRENVKYYKEENYAILVRTLDFRNNFEKDLTYTDKHGYEFLSNSNLFGGELLLSNIGSIGKVFIVPKLNKRMTLAPNSIMVRHYDDSQRDWLYYFFLSPVGQEVLLSISSSTTQAKFNKTQLKGVLVPLPPLAEQKRIVNKIEEIFASLDEISLHLV